MRMQDDKYFARMIKDIIRHEGGYSNHPADSGGETKFGISKKKYKHLDIKSLTLEQAKTIYYYDYYLPTNINRLTLISPKLASKVLDAQVHTGRGILFLCKALAELGYSVPYTGKVNDDILLAVKEIKDQNRIEQLIDKICQIQENFYRELIRNRPKDKVFEKNWIHTRAKYRGIEEAS